MPALNAPLVLTDEQMSGVSDYTKSLFASTENFGNITGDWLQLEKYTFNDLKNRNKIRKDIPFNELSKNPQLYDEVAQAYIKDLKTTFKLPDDETAALWSYRPGWYRRYGGEIKNIPDTARGSFGKTGRQVMQQRMSAINQYLKSSGKEQRFDIGLFNPFRIKNAEVATVPDILSDEQMNDGIPSILTDEQMSAPGERFMPSDFRTEPFTKLATPEEFFKRETEIKEIVRDIPEGVKGLGNIFRTIATPLAPSRYTPEMKKSMVEGARFTGNVVKELFWRPLTGWFQSMLKEVSKRQFKREDYIAGKAGFQSLPRAMARGLLGIEDVTGAEILEAGGLPKTEELVIKHPILAAGKEVWGATLDVLPLPVLQPIGTINRLIKEGKYAAADKLAIETSEKIAKARYEQMGKPLGKTWEQLPQQTRNVAIKMTGEAPIKQLGNRSISEIFYNRPYKAIQELAKRQFVSRAGQLRVGDFAQLGKQIGKITGFREGKALLNIAGKEVVAGLAQLKPVVKPEVVAREYIGVEPESAKWKETWKKASPDVKYQMRDYAKKIAKTPKSALPLKELVESLETRWEGVWDLGGVAENQVQFTDVKTGATMSMPISQITPEKVKAYIENKRKQFVEGGRLAPEEVEVKPVPPEAPIKPKEPPGKPPISPPTATIAPQPEPPTDPVQKVISALKKAKSVRGKQERLYAEERAKRIARAKAVGKKVKGEKGFYAELGQLKGKLPKAQFEAIRSEIGQEDIDNLFNKIKDNPLLNDWQKMTTRTGLAKLFGEYGGVVPTGGELKLLKRVFGEDFTKAILDKRRMWQKIKEAGYQIVNIPRSIMASFDLSAPFRQGVFFIGRGKQFWSAFGKMFKPFVSEKAFQALKADIVRRPTFSLMDESGLSLTEMGEALGAREEAFMSQWAEKIPGVGPVVRASGRAYVGFLNKLRADVFDDLVKKATALGLDPRKNKDLLRAIAKYVNTGTGRGHLGGLERAAVGLNAFFFSPRLMASRLSLLNPIYYISQPPFVRKEALKDLFIFASVGMSILGMAKLAGLKVGADPRSSDFGKIKIGNTRIDLWGGFQPYIRMAAQLITGEYVSSTTGKIITLGEGYRPLTRADILQRQIEGKFSPVMSFANTLLKGKTFAGQPVDVPKEVGLRFAPMVVQDMYDIMQEDPTLLPISGLAIFGVGMQTYKGREKSPVKRWREKRKTQKSSLEEWRKKRERQK